MIDKVEGGHTLCIEFDRFEGSQMVDGRMLLRIFYQQFGGFGGGVRVGVCGCRNSSTVA